jgi:hypothetical protein
MTSVLRIVTRFLVTIMVGAFALSWNGKLPLWTQSSLISSAEAIIGRPLTPFSYAGVARRTTRRAVGVGVAAGAVYGGAVYGGAVYGAPAVVVAPPVVVAPSCVQAVDPYGRIYTRCY